MSDIILRGRGQKIYTARGAKAHPPPPPSPPCTPLSRHREESLSTINTIVCFSSTTDCRSSVGNLPWHGRSCLLLWDQLSPHHLSLAWKACLANTTSAWKKDGWYSSPILSVQLHATIEQSTNRNCILHSIDSNSVNYCCNNDGAYILYTHIQWFHLSLYAL